MALTKVQSEMSNANAPAFYVYRTASQTFTNSTFTKVQFNIEAFDTNSNFDSTTNYRFTPTVAGYYQINGIVSFAGSTVGYGITAIYKNGAAFIIGSAIPNNNSQGACSNVSGVIYFNGSTDYVELWAWQNSGGDLGLQTTANGHRVNFSGCLMRAE